MRTMCIRRTIISQNLCILVWCPAWLQELGGSPFHEAMDADEVDGLEEAIERWVAGLWAPLQRAMTAKGAAPPEVTAVYRI